MRKKFKFLLFLSSLALVTFSVGCSGDNLANSTSNDSSLSNPSTTTPNPANGADVINPFVSGFLFYQDGFMEPYRSYRLDMATGTVEFLPDSANWLDIFGAGTGLVFARPAEYERSEIALSAKGCGTSVSERVCIAIRDAAGNTVSRFNVNGRTLTSAAKLSRDKSFIAYMADVRGLDGYRLEVYSREGEFVRGFQFPEERGFQWLEDGRIILNNIREFVIVDPLDSSLTFPTVLLPDSQPGFIGHFNVSPDGEKVAYVRLNQTNAGLEHTLHTVDLKSFSTRRILKPKDISNLATLSQPHWSPDGNWILIHVGTPNDISNSGLSLFMYAVRWDNADTVIVDPYGPMVHSEELVKLRNYALNGTLEVRWPRRDLYWQP